MNVQLVPAEDATSALGGSIYPGDHVRIVMRSPTHFVFTSLGARIWDRSVMKTGSWHGETRLFHDRPTIAAWSKPEVLAKIDAVFGSGAGELALKAWRTRKTALVDGGGDELPRPRRVVVRLLQSAYDAAKPDRRLDLPELARCKQCGEPLRPSTDHHRLGFDIKPDHPRSLDDCQLLTNHRVIACHGYGLQHPTRLGLVSWFETWDGESYIDADFCSSRCAAIYGRRAARELPPLPPGGEEPLTPYRRREDVDHYDRVEAAERQRREIERLMKKDA